MVTFAVNAALLFFASVLGASNAANTRHQLKSLSCPPDYVANSAWDACYKSVSEPATRATADENCRTDGAYLASVLSSDENTVLSDNADGEIWLGLQRIANGYLWDDGWRVNFTNWDYLQPSLHNCALMTMQQTWTAVNCSESHGYVCKITLAPAPMPPPTLGGACPSGWAAWADHCYYFTDPAWIDGDVARTWSEAQNVCDARAGQIFNATLASIHSEAENDYISDMVLSRGIPNYPLWIGLQQNGSSFNWSDDTPVQYTKWAPGEPNYGSDQQCGSMHLDVTAAGGQRYWTDVSCSAQHQNLAVCKTPQDTGVPNQCSMYMELTDTWRYVDSNAFHNSHCDDDLQAGWYRLSLDGSKAIITKQCPHTGQTCGTAVHYWHSGALPTAGNTITGIAYGLYAYPYNDCYRVQTPIQITNCTGYYVYYLLPIVQCDGAYCSDYQQG